jgi:hypothetical protein
VANARTVTFNSQDQALVAAGKEWGLRGDGEGFLCHIDDIDEIKAVDLRSALQSYAEWHWGQPEGDVTGLSVTSVPSGYLDEDSPVEDVGFVMDFDLLCIEVTFSSYEYLSKDENPQEVNSFEKALAPFLDRSRVILTSWALDPYYQNPYIVRIRLAPSVRGRSVGDLFRVGKDVISLVEAMQGGGLTRETTLDLLRGGHSEVLIGQPEGPWLDVKSDHYDLSRPSGKISLSQAVARFANAEHGGIVVVGMRGKRVPGGEEIRSVCPVPFERGIERKYQQSIEQHLYPPPDYLEIESVKVSTGMLVLVHIPPQPEELKPFLVSGAIVDDGVEGAFISIVRRRGESSIPTTAAAIHATLAAGRALLRRGQLPTDPP